MDRDSTLHILCKTDTTESEKELTLSMMVLLYIYIDGEVVPYILRLFTTVIIYREYTGF